MWGCVSILWHSFLSSSPFLHDHWQVKGLDRLSLNCYYLPSPDQISTTPDHWSAEDRRPWKGSCFNVGDGNNVCIQYQIIPSPLVPSHHALVLNLLTPNGFAINMLQLQMTQKLHVVCVTILKAGSISGINIANIYVNWVLHEVVNIIWLSDPSLSVTVSMASVVGEPCCAHIWHQTIRISRNGMLLVTCVARVHKAVPPPNTSIQNPDFQSTVVPSFF